MSSPCYLSPEALHSQDLSSILLSLFLLISPLPEPSDFTSGHHTGLCQLYNPGIYGVFNHCSQLPYFHPLEHNLFFFFPAEGNTLPCNDLLKMSNFIALPSPQGKSKILICFPQAGLFLLHYIGTYPLPKPYTLHEVKESHWE